MSTTEPGPARGRPLPGAAEAYYAHKTCGAHHDRDINAAKVIRAAGLAVQACGDGVRPPRT